VKGAEATFRSAILGDYEEYVTPNVCSKVGFFMVGRTDRVKLGIHLQKIIPKCLFKSELTG